MKKVKYTNPNHSTDELAEPFMTYAFPSSVNVRHIESLRNGVSATQVEKVQALFGLTQVSMAETLHLTPKTLRVKIKEKGRVDALQGSLIMAMIEVGHLGQSLFGGKAQFISWLNMTSQALGDRRPITLIDTFQGLTLLRSELESIADGNFA
ncbi:MAG: DUF2384 domain-containing protein [Cyclobacteriaceae bacterium]